MRVRALRVYALRNEMSHDNGMIIMAWPSAPMGKLIMNNVIARKVG